MFLLYGPHPATVLVLQLPDPELDDAVALLVDVNIKRTMSGARRSYVKNKNRKVYKYNFTLTKAQADDLVDFCRDYLSEQIKVEFDDDIIIGHITNNPIEVIVTSRGCGQETTGVILTIEG